MRKIGWIYMVRDFSVRVRCPNGVIIAPVGYGTTEEKAYASLRRCVNDLEIVIFKN